LVFDFQTFDFMTLDSEKNKYDHVVVGGGISGLTAAVLLAQGGRNKVLLLEKAPALGGSMARFSLGGIPFDTGFHFTGGLAPGELLHDMLKALGIDHQIHPQPLDGKKGTRLVFEATGKEIAFPCSRAGVLQALRSTFPEEQKAIDAYFEKVDSVCARTTSMDLRCLGDGMEPLEEDFQTLEKVLGDLTDNRELQAALGSYFLCYGATPSEISFANHARICQGMHDGIVRVENGGDAFVSALRKKLDEAGVEIRCGTHVVACEEVADRQVGLFRLNSGEGIRFDSALLTIHPKAILGLLPRESIRKAFANRVSDFESSFGFLAVFGVCDAPELLDDFILIGLPGTDFAATCKPGVPESDSLLFCISGMEERAGKPCRTLSILEAAYPRDFSEWEDSSLMKRPVAYSEYKARKTERMVERVLEQLPQLEGHFKVLGTSSPLTFRDYLHSPDGSAYGIKQKTGQFNLLGRLPLRNLYAAGQSALLPGVMGAMVSSFMVCRTLLGAEEFDQEIKLRLE